MQQGGKPDRSSRSAGIVPDMMKRGAVRSVFDGRYVFTRYFSPKQHNRPATLEELTGSTTSSCSTCRPTQPR